VLAEANWCKLVNEVCGFVRGDGETEELGRVLEARGAECDDLSEDGSILFLYSGSGFQGGVDGRG